MTTVLILGSKPGALIPKFDIAYCANSSGALYAGCLEKKGDVLNTVVAASELIPNPIRVSEEKLKWQVDRIQAINNLKNHHIKLISSEFFPDVLQNLAVFDRHKSLQLIPHSKYEIFLKKNLNIHFPILTEEHLKTSNSILKEISRFALECVRYNFSSQYLVNPLYRQSTGLTCLLEAISSFGTNARYKVVGIGFKNRNIYEGGGINTWTPAAKMARSHVLADRFIYETVRLKYDVHFYQD
jgi:hypothetical protein